MKNFCAIKNTILEKKGNAAKKLIFRIQKHLLQINEGKRSSRKIDNEFLRDDIQMANKHRKMLTPKSNQQRKLNHNENTATQSPGRLRYTNW